MDGPIPEGHSQADLVNDLTFDVDPSDPLTKAALEDHPQDEWIDIFQTGQLKKKTIVKGQKNQRPERFNICTLKIVCKLLDSQKIVQDIPEMKIQLGDTEINQGLDLAIGLMEEGETAEVEIASRFAYGETGLEPDIPPGASLLYTVELKSIEVEPDIEEMDLPTRRNIANTKRERGNWWFQRNDPHLAVQCYRRALEYLNPSKTVSTDGGGADAAQTAKSTSDDDVQTMIKDQTVVYNNLTLALIKVDNYEAALESVENVLRSEPENVKALYRKGKILHKKGDYAQARETLLKVSRFMPESKEIQNELTILKAKVVRDTKDEMHLYRKMLGSPKSEKSKQPEATSNGKTFDGSNKQKNSWKNTTKVATYCMVGGVAAALAAGIAYRFVA